jgi:hypothetical protein
MSINISEKPDAFTFTPSNNLQDLTSQKNAKYVQQFKLLTAAQYLQMSLRKQHVSGWITYEADQGTYYMKFSRSSM